MSVRIVRDSFTQDEFDKKFGYYHKPTPIKKQISNYLHKSIKRCTPWSLVKKFVPIFRWLPEYKFHYLSNDIIAGSTVAILNIPQAMAYAALAGVPAIIGLYTSFLPALLYMIFGTSKHISLGMFAVIALMTGNVEQRVRSDHVLTSNGFNGSLENNESVQIIATLTFAVGLVLAVMALLQVHFVSAYLSDELIGGFTTGAAYHVMWSQIPKIFALKLPKRKGLFVLFKIMYDFFKNIRDTNFWSLVISVCCMVFLYLSKRFLNPFVGKYCPIPIPLELIVVIVTTVLSNIMEFHKKHGVVVVGKIPTGFPLPALPKLDKLHSMFPDAIVIAVVIYAVSFSVAKLFAKKHKYKLNPAQEIRAISAVQILSAFMLCHPASASLSRSTINSQLGVHSQLSSMVSSGVMLLLILWIGPLVENLPMCVLASVILIALQTMLFQITQLKSLWKTSKYDFAIWLVSFLGTILWDVSEGLVIAIFFTLLTIVIRVQKPKTMVLNQISETKIYRDPENYVNFNDNPNASIFRFEAPLLFVNCDEFKIRISKIQKKFLKKFIIIDANPIIDLDKMGTNTLIEIVSDFSTKSTKILIAAPNHKFLIACEKFKTFEKIDKNLFFPTIFDAVNFIEKFSDSCLPTIL